MKKKQAKFSSNKIIQSEANKLVAEKIVKNMNFLTTTATKNNKQISLKKDENEQFFNSVFNASDLMVNFFTKKPAQVSNTHQNNFTRNTNIRKSSDIHSFSNSSNKIARSVQNSILSKKDSTYLYDSLINNSSIDQGLRSSNKLSRSLLDTSENKSRIGYSKEKQMENSLRYEDFIKYRPSIASESELRNRNSKINFSYAEEYKHKPEASKKEKLLEEFLIKKLGSKSKRTNEMNFENHSQLISSAQPNIGYKASFKTISGKPNSNNADLVVNSKTSNEKNKANNTNDRNKKDFYLKKGKENDNSKSPDNKLKAKEPKISKIQPIQSKRNNTNTKKEFKNVDIFQIKVTNDEIIENSNILSEGDNVNMATNPSFSQNKNEGTKRSLFKPGMDYNNKISPIESPKNRKDYTGLQTLENDIIVLTNPLVPKQKDIEYNNVPILETKDKPNSIIQPKLTITKKKDIDEDEEYGDIDEFDNVADNRHINKYYKTLNKGKIADLDKYDQDTVSKCKKNEELSIRQYDKMVNKYLFGVSDKQVNPNENSFTHNPNHVNHLNESHISKSSQIDIDLETVISAKCNIKQIKKYYKYEVKLLKRELYDLENIKNVEYDKLKEKKGREIHHLKEKIKEDEKGMSDNQDTSNTISSKVRAELDTLKSNLILKENNYKSIIKNLLSEMKNASVSNLNNNSSINNSEVIDINDSMLKEINEVIEDSIVDESKYNNSLVHSTKKESYNTQNQNNHTHSTTTQITKSKTENKNSIAHNKLEIENLEDDSMIAELEEFKEDELSNYKFEVPLKYQMSKNAKIESEIKRDDGKIVKYYDNSVVEIITKNKNLTRLFPDGYSITFYPNKDIKQTFSQGRTLYYYSKNKSLEFNMQNEGFIAYRFKNDQFEKHFFDGRKYIKFSDGSIKILRPNGEELNEFTNKSIQRKDKLGNITTKKL